MHERTRQAVAEDAVRGFLAEDTAARALGITVGSVAPGAVTATAVERAVVGRSGIYDVAVTRDSDGQLLAELRAHSRQLTGPPTSA